MDTEASADDDSTESVLAEWAGDFAFLGLSPDCDVKLTCIARVTGGTGTYRLRVGGTPGAADGTIAAAFTSSSTSDQQRIATGTIPNPGPQALIKLTGRPSASPQRAFARGAVVRIETGDGMLYAHDAEFQINGAVDGTGEVLLHEWSDDLAAIGGVTLNALLAGIVNATGGATGIFRVRVGGAIGATDGTVAAAITTTDVSPTQRTATGTVANPGAQGLVKLTGQISSAGQRASIRGIVAALNRVSGGSAAPVVTNITPAPGAIPGTFAEAVNTPIEFDITDDVGLLFVGVTFKLADRMEKLKAFDGTRFVYPFDSSTSQVTPIAGGYRFRILPRGGWPANIEQMWVYGPDVDGNLEGGALPP
jgi:hypothetical protein